MLSFFSVFVIAFFVAVLVVGIAFVPRNWPLKRRVAGWLLAALVLFFGFLGPFLARSLLRESLSPQTSAEVARFAFLPLAWAAIVTMLALAKLAGDVGWALAARRMRMRGSSARVEWLRLLWKKWAVVGALTASLVLLDVGHWRAHSLVVERVSVAVPGLPEPVGNLRIALLSDMHIGGGVPASLVDDAIARVNGLAADLVVLSGDIWEGELEPVVPVLRKFRTLKSVHGCFYVVGNHERRDARDDWARAAEHMGCKLLDDGAETIERGNTRIQVAGVSDRRRHWAGSGTAAADEPEVVAVDPRANLRLLLLHRPDAAEAWTRRGFHLVLSGHTHSGQFWPFSFFVAATQPYFHGLYALTGGQLYVSRGTGYWGPPVRFPGAGEVSLLEVEALPRPP